MSHSIRYDHLIEAAARVSGRVCAIAHPCDEVSLGAALEAAHAGIFDPVLVGPEARIRKVAEQHAMDLSGVRMVDAAHSHAAADAAVAEVQAGRATLLMKGSLHTDELMQAVLNGGGPADGYGPADGGGPSGGNPNARHGRGLRTARRISHVFIMDVPAYEELLFITDAAINIFPDLEIKADIIRNVIDLHLGLGMGTPRIAILSAVEQVGGRIPSTIDAAALCKMAERGQIEGGLLDGPLALDNAISPEAARIKGIRSEVAGRANVLVVPDLEAGNMLAKNLTFLSGAEAAGIVLGARVPIILTSRADSVRSRLASCAVAALYADHLAGRRMPDT